MTKEGRRFFLCPRQVHILQVHSRAPHPQLRPQYMTSGLCPLTFFLSVWDPPQKKRHAEIRFIDKINSLGLDQDQSYEITCYVTWSPCATCACKLIKFTRKFPNLSLRIFVSRLYYHWFRQNQQGLRQLWASSIPVVVMGYQEFADCWENFADNRGNPFQSWEKLTEYSKGIKRRLQKILEPLKLNGLEDAMGNLKLGSVDLG
ncbi:DNA dC-_dU-editing enzyme APOBEC-3H isoform X2 [Equus quagga]|uniref:DNA dC->dU-editing enzyme APOBEC-3H isoform X2 n=1 Tax=Equus quagga TaxID=89248 RepID=UPI001EE20D39|nr:DNA dC->dU-editing enzyme APOBEC-3H isoform X2 [Equus quagga]